MDVKSLEDLMKLQKLVLEQAARPTAGLGKAPDPAAVAKAAEETRAANLAYLGARLQAVTEARARLVKEHDEELARLKAQLEELKRPEPADPKPKPGVVKPSPDKRKPTGGKPG